MPATMPPKMMIEIPLPMPFSVISSPSHTRNIVPAVIANSAVIVGSAFVPLMPGLNTASGAMRCSSTSCAYPWTKHSGTAIQCW